MKKSIVPLLAMLAGAFLAPVHADAQESDANCQATFDLQLKPGISAEPSSGTFAPIEGTPDKIVCDGSVNGKRTTGPGTWSVSGRYGTDDGDSCTSGGEGDGTQEWSVPTEDGEERVVNRITFEFGALQGGGAFGGTFDGDRYDGTFEVSPKKGDCFSEPLTEIDLVVRFSL